jgi:hypothetical protein
MFLDPNEPRTEEEAAYLDWQSDCLFEDVLREAISNGYSTVGEMIEIENELIWGKQEIRS